MAISPNDFLGAFQQHFGQFLPDLAKTAQDDVQQQMKVMLSSVISKLDLVTREEFEVQAEVLRRTRDKVEQLEKRMEELERLVAESPAQES